MAEKTLSAGVGTATETPPRVPTLAPRVRRRSSLTRRRRITGLLCVAPALVLVTVFFLIPLVLTFWVSLHRWPLLGGEHTFIGLENYRQAFADDTFRRSALFTLEYTLLVTPLLFFVALALALLVKERRRGAGFFRTVFFVPVVVGFASASFLWVWLINPQVGPLGRVLDLTGLVEQQGQWLAGATSALFVVLAMVTWKIAGMQMILLMSGMQSIPQELHEAARMDGAGRWTSFSRITLPLLRPTIAFVLVFSVAGSLLAFDQFYIMTKGGPSNETLTAVYSVYRASFTGFQLGYGSAISVLLMLVLAVVSGIQLYLLRDNTEY